MKEEVKWGSEALKFNTSCLLLIERLLEPINKHKVAGVDEVKNLEGEVAVLSQVLNVEGDVKNPALVCGGEEYVSQGVFWLQKVA